MISSMILQLDFLQNHLPCDKVAGHSRLRRASSLPRLCGALLSAAVPSPLPRLREVLQRQRQRLLAPHFPSSLRFERADRSLPLSVPPQPRHGDRIAQQVPEYNRASSLAIPYRWRSAPSPTTSGCWQAPSTPLTPRSRSRASSSSWATSSASSTSCTAT